MNPSLPFLPPELNLHATSSLCHYDALPLKQIRILNAKTDISYSLYQEFTKVVEERQVSYTYIIETLETLIQQTSSISNARILEKTLNDVRASWEAVVSLSENQTVKLQSCLEMTVAFSDNSKRLELWLITMEERCIEFDTPAILLEPLENQLSSLKVCLSSRFSSYFSSSSDYKSCFHIVLAN